MSEDVWHPLATALTAQPSRPRVAAAATPVREQALEAMQRGRLREAALRLRRQLRDEVVSGSWEDEHGARILLASVYQNAGEMALAVHHLVLAGAADEVEDLGAAAGDLYFDVREHLRAPTYWTQATAFRLIAAQADLLPNAHVQEVAEHGLSVLDAARAGTLVDTPFFAPSVHLAAHMVLAELADRLSYAHSARLLDHLAPLASAAEGVHRHTDDAHAMACAAVGDAYPELREEALDQLVQLLRRSPHSVKTSAWDLLTDNLPLVEVRLEALAEEGNRTAAEVLAYAQPQGIDPAAARAAEGALTAPLISGPGHFAIGTAAVGQSIIAAQLPADRRAKLVREQLRRVRSSHEGGLNRSEYLLAAANLATDLAEADVSDLLPLALAEASDSSPSEADDLARAFSHPLSAMRVSVSRESRPAAAFLAARLARTPEQREQSRAAVLRLIGKDGGDDYYVTRALQLLKTDLERDIPYLAKQQGWALRSLAAIVWVQSGEADERVGTALAADPDPRVRRALAEALAKVKPEERTTTARDALRGDPRYSVRRLLGEAWHD